MTHRFSNIYFVDLYLEIYQVCQIFSCQNRIRQTSKLQYKRQQNVVANLLGHPVHMHSLAVVMLEKTAEGKGECGKYCEKRSCAQPQKMYAVAP